MEFTTGRRITAESIVAAAAATGNQCPDHPAYEADNCPGIHFLKDEQLDRRPLR